MFLCCFVLSLSSFWNLLPSYLFSTLKSVGNAILFQLEGPRLKFTCRLHVTRRLPPGRVFYLQGELFCIRRFVPEHVCEQCINTRFVGFP